MRSPATRVVLAAVLAAALGTAASSQAPSSAELAKQLVSTLTGRGLDAMAARDPEKSDYAIAALAFPGSQLLVVAGPYADVAGLEALLAHKMYREVYAALQQPSVTAGKLFVQDLGCDGLQSSGGSIDIVYEDAKIQTILDGNWKKQGLSQAAYQARARDLEAKYARLLGVLIGATQNRAG